MTATLLGIYRYPLKSAAGQRLSSAEIDATGVVGDRSWALQRDGKMLRAKDFPELSDWTARLVGEDLELDDGSGFAPAADALHRLAPGATLVRADEGHRMVAAIHLVSDNASQEAGAPEVCDPHPRANLVIGGVRPGAERDWLDQEIAIGEVTLRITQIPKHCLGVYAEVLHGGVVGQGAAILAGSRT